MLEMTEQLSIRDRASAALRAAMRARDTEAVAALRLSLSEAEMVAIARREHEELAHAAEHADMRGAHAQADSRRRRCDVVASLLDG
jgi:uncharacterized protein YqeY